MKTFPSVFVSHGAPTYATQPGRAGAQLRALGSALGKPQGIVIVSPHWMTRGVQVTASAAPETVHDFGGFPSELYSLRYPAPGAPELAARAAQLLAPLGQPVSLHPTRGLDHGAWVPLMHMYPDADVPVVQVSMPYGGGEQEAFALGKALAPLAAEGVLVIGSGSLTHNLYEFRSGQVREEDYAIEFTHWIRGAVQGGDQDKLLHALERAPHARRAHPTSDHFLPLLVALGASPDANVSSVIEGGIQHGVLSMESYVLGAAIELPEPEEEHA